MNKYIVAGAIACTVAIAAEAVPPARIDASPPSRETAASKAFFTSVDLKPFITNASSNPSAASFFYATLAIRECELYMGAMRTLEGKDSQLWSDEPGLYEFAKSIFAIGVERSAMSPKRRAIVESYEQRCSWYPQFNHKLLRKLGDDGVAAGDVGFAVLTPLTSKMRTSAERAELPHKMVEGLYSTQDAGVMWAAARELALSSDALSISGRQLSTIERSSLPAALMLTTCEFGAACDASNPLVRWECLMRDWCDVSSLQELFKKSDTLYWLPYTEFVRFDLRTALQLRDEIVRGIASGDCTVLTYRPSD